MQLKLRELRKAKGITLVRLSELSDISPSQISKIERGVKKPKLDTICRLAKALEVTLSDLVVCD